MVDAVTAVRKMQIFCKNKCLFCIYGEGIFLYNSCKDFVF